MTSEGVETGRVAPNAHERHGEGTVQPTNACLGGGESRSGIVNPLVRGSSPRGPTAFGELGAHAGVPSQRNGFGARLDLQLVQAR